MNERGMASMKVIAAVVAAAWINALAEPSPVTIDLQVQHAIGDLRLLAE
jgi:hypothetical protein